MAEQLMINLVPVSGEQSYHNQEVQDVKFGDNGIQVDLVYPKGHIRSLWLPYHNIQSLTPWVEEV
jgi:hypothetical protein